MINIILSGGSGTRLWPLSRKLEPKQFYKLINNRSLFQETILRNKKLCEKQMIVLNSETLFMAQAQLDEIKVANSNFLIETVGKSSAPAIVLACLSLDPEEIVLVTPSDHFIKGSDNYFDALTKAQELAKADFMVTFGITPNYPDTGFGYIEYKGNDVIHFHEKPSLEKAEEYLTQGNYYWNSGFFVFKVKVLLDEINKFEPEILITCKEAYDNRVIDHENAVKIPLEFMQKIPEKSIDFAVMEKSDKIKVVHADIEWSDLGSFDSLYQMLPKDENNTTLIDGFKSLSATKIQANKENISIDAKNNLIFSTNRSIVAVDIEDLIIVDTPDALLITKKGSSQRVREVVEKLKMEESSLHSIHLTAHRPWGTYTILEESDNYKIKRIMVKQGKRLSLQMHHHRSEHWVVVQGTAKVKANDEEKIIGVNESFYVSKGAVHRLENPGKIPLVIIEVQVGEYLGEDDIVRLEDDFKRNI